MHYFCYVEVPVFIECYFVFSPTDSGYNIFFIVGSKIAISYKDLEELNQMSLANKGETNKISFNTLGKILDDYVLLPVGSCLGFNNGPKIIAKEKFSLKDLKNKKIGVFR